MSNLSFHATSGSISISFPNGNQRRSETISSTDSRYNKIIDLLKQFKTTSDKLALEDQIIQVVTRANLFKQLGDLKLNNGVLTLDGFKLPEVLTKRILDFEREGLPYQYLVNFFRKLLNNPNPRSIEMLYKFLEHNGHPITDQGNFIAYRKVDDNFKDLYTGKIDNSIGNVVQMDRGLVDSDPEKTCSSGLHVATRCYAEGFGRGVLLEVEVDPADVVCVPNDYNGTKMRVCKFRVLAESESLREESAVETSEQHQVDLDDNQQDQVELVSGVQVTVPSRFKRKVNASGVDYVEYRSNNLTVMFNSGGKYRAYAPAKDTVARVLNAVNSAPASLSSVIRDLTGQNKLELHKV